eukprot:5019544-Pyramimonas_sp.AAC.1
MSRARPPPGLLMREACQRAGRRCRSAFRGVLDLMRRGPSKRIRRRMCGGVCRVRRETDRRRSFREAWTAQGGAPRFSPGGAGRRG